MATATQDGRYMRIESALGKDVLLLKRFAGNEAVSQLFEFHAEVLSDRVIAPTDLLEKEVTLVVVQEDGTERPTHGLVRSVVSLGPEKNFHAYRLHVVPQLWLLTLSQNCRIFQEKDVKQIVGEVLGDIGHRFDCKGAFPKREFTVQYRESDFAFVSRLLEEEGIFYFFEHSGGSHKLVLADHQGAIEESPTQGIVTFQAPGDRVYSEGIVDHVASESSVRSTKYVMRDYNFETPSSDMTAQIGGGSAGELYDYPGLYVRKGDGDRLAEVRLQAEESLKNMLTGAGNSLGMIPGYRFELQDSEDEDGEYLVLRVEHRSGTINYTTISEGESDAEPPYRNSFTAIPFATPYRPPRLTSVPRMAGAQTAVVVGPKGEETYTDEYGRVKVRFHWDRLSPDNGESSCWIRVASTWAGNKWGGFQLPRVGQEVVVDFLEGSPDRPLITGSVYNAEQMPPFDANPTQSGWKSHSTKNGGAESNEFRFEDKKGSEEIYLRAEKDHKVVVVNDEAFEIGHDRTATVENDDTLTVKKDQKITVKNNQTATIEKDQKITVKNNQTATVEKGNRSIQVKKGNLTTKAALGKISFEAMQAIELKVGPTTVKIEPSGVTISGPMVKVEAKGIAEIKGALTKVEAQGPVMVKGALAQVQGQGPVMVKGTPTMIG